MADLFHEWGCDLALGSTGDLALASAGILGQQRLLRRLLTNPGDYIWHLDYGAGLARFIGTPASPLHIRAVVRSQLFKEPVVARVPEPMIDVDLLPAGGANVYIHLRYSDSQSAQTQALTFSVGVT